MAIKISKVAKDLNVGISTLVEFLQKNNQNVEDNLNTRITDEQYEMLVRAFKNDKDLKSKSDKYSSDRHKEKAKPAPAPHVAPKEEIKTVVVPQPKVVGKINLDEINKPKVVETPKPQKTEEKPVEKPVEKASVKPVAETGDWWQRLRWWLMQHIFGSYTHKDIVWLDLLLKVLAGLIVVFGIYKLVRSKFWLTAKSKPDFQKTMDPWIGEAWNELSYRQMLEQAVAENDFKLAIRIRYGGLLHLMDEKGMIRWDAHKTNRSYYYELKDKALRDDFEKLAYIFDCVCYGDFEVSASLYGQLEPVFDEFRDKLKK